MGNIGNKGEQSTNTEIATLTALTQLAVSPVNYAIAKTGVSTFANALISGTISSVSVVTANGVSGSVDTPTTTPAITLTLGAITPTTVNNLTLSSTSITSNGALSLIGGGTNQNITLTPSGTGYTILNGNVGIGTTGPGGKLAITTTDLTISQKITGPTGATGEYIQFVATTDGGDIRIGKQSGVNNNMIFGTWTNNDIQIYTNTTEKLHLSSAGGLSLGSTYVGTDPGAGSMIISGNVGIGTTNPGALLDLGLAGTTLGVIRLAGNTSGNVSLQPNAVAGSGIILTLPSTTGTLVNSVTTANGVSAINTSGALSFTLGAITPTTVNSLTITTSTGTLTITNAKTLSVSNTLTLAGTDTTTMTFPTTSATIARTDAGQTFTGTQVMTSPKIITAILDTNANTQLSMIATGSAVNYIEFTNAATGTAGPIIAAQGETNIDLKIAAKGTGGVHHTTGVYGDITADTDGATITFNLATSNIHSVTLGGNRTLALSNGKTGQCFMLRLLQDVTGSRTVTWFTTIKWAGGSAPTLTTTASKADLIGFLITGSNTYDGFVVGANI